MPVDKQVLLRYRVLNKCFRDQFKKYTIDDLVEECNKAMREANEKFDSVSKRTIQSDIANLQKAPYKIRLDEKLKNGRKRVFRYYDTFYSLPLIKINDRDRNKILAAVNVLENYSGDPLLDWARTLLMQIESGLFGSDSSSVVSFQSNPDLKNISLFGDLLQAIINKKVLKLTYAPFGKDSYQERIYPYYLKQYNDRWYLIAQAVGYDTLAHYALDRINGFEEIALPYKEPDFDLFDYFYDVIGVTIPDEPSQKIFIKVFGSSANYVKTKPLHSTQTPVEDGDGYIIVSINVKPNYELDSKILSFGPNMEVLAPASYRAHISEKIKEMNQKYQNNAENLHT